MTNIENQGSGDAEIDEADRGGDDVAASLAEILGESDRGRERIVQFLQALDLQVMGACRADERLKPLLKLNVSCDAAEDRLLAHLSQHFEPSEVGMLARCLCIPLVSIRVGKINTQGTLLCPTAVRGNLSLTLLPTSDLRISFTGDDGLAERLITLTNDSQCSDIAIEEIPSDTSGRSFLLKVPDGNVFYFWCSEKSKFLGSELLMKMKDLLKKKPTLAELTGISNTRLECFATHLCTYLGSSLSTTRTVSVAFSSDAPSDSSEFCRTTKSSSSPSKPLRSRNVASQSFQISLSPRSGSFKEGASRNLSSLKSVCREKQRRRDNQFSIGDNLSIASSNASSSSSQILHAKDHAKEQFLTRNALDPFDNSTSPPFLCPGSQVTSLASSLLSPYYCWRPPVASTLQYTILPPQFSLSSTESPSLPPLSSLLPVNRSSNVLTPPLENSDMPKLDFPPLFPEPLMRFPLPRSSSQPIATFTPLMCDPIVHIPVIDVCSSGPGYLVSTGSTLSTTIPPLLPKLGNPLIPESDSDVEKGARETLRLLINGSTQTNPQLMEVLPSVFTVADERHSVLATGSRGLYSGVRDVSVLANSFTNLELVSVGKLICEDGAKERGASQGNLVDEVEKPGGSGANDLLSNSED